MKKSEEDRLKCVVYESTRAPPKKEANPASLCSAAPSKGRGSRGRSLLPMEGGALKGRRLDGESGMKKSEEIISSTPFARAPYPPLRGPPSPRGEGGPRKASRIGFWRYERERGDRLRATIHESTLYKSNL